MSYDTIVIGGGVMGSSLALRLAQGGQKVLVLERAVPGAEASGAAGGILGPQIEGEREDALFRFGLASRDDYPSFSRELFELSGVDVGFSRCGLLQVVLEGDDPRPLEERYRWQKEAGLPVERLSGKEARELEPALSDSTSLALRFQDEGRVDPRALASALPIAAAREGATFRKGRVERIRVEGGRAVGVDLDAESIAAGAVVVAAGAWTTSVEGVPLPKDAIEPLRGQMVELSLPMPLESVVYTPRGYLVPKGGSVVAGSTMERVGYEKKVTAEGLSRILDHARTALPSLAGAEVLSHWCGLRPCSKDGLPLVGRTTTPGLYVSSGHHRNGILLTPRTASLLAQAILEDREVPELAPFSPSRFPM